MDARLLAQIIGIEDGDTATAMTMTYEALPIEWHCEGRHGVLRDVPSAQAGHVQKVIEWFLGSGACRWTNSVNGTRSVEFVHMTKVFPAPTKPWGWCGTTILFSDWQKQVSSTEAAVRAFTAGDRVWFDHKGATKTGLVAYVNTKTVNVIVEGEGAYTVPPSLLRRTV